MLYLGNAFSLNMLSSSVSVTLRVTEITTEQVFYLLSNFDFVSAVGHSSTADVISKMLGISVPSNRVAISLSSSDKLIVFQLLTRLPEGAVLSEEEIKSLPHKWFLVEVL